MTIQEHIMKEEMQDDLWCIVANVKKEVPYGPGGAETKSGLKKFKAGAKVNIIGSYPGMCNDIIVVGQHRQSGKYIRCVIRAKNVENLRVKLIYSKSVIDLARGYQPNGALMCTSKEGAYELAGLIPKWVNENEA